MPDIRILTEGDSSVLVEFGKKISPEINRKITATVQLMKEQHIEGVVDMIPAFCSLLVNYDPRVISYDDLKKRLEILLKMEVTAAPPGGILDRYYADRTWSYHGCSCNY